jgi:hypothetical protein
LDKVPPVDLEGGNGHLQGMSYKDRRFSEKFTYRLNNNKTRSSFNKSLVQTCSIGNFKRIYINKKLVQASDPDLSSHLTSMLKNQKYHKTESKPVQGSELNKLLNVFKGITGTGSDYKKLRPSDFNDSLCKKINGYSNHPR